jgi:hypothetical protein
MISSLVALHVNSRVGRTNLLAGKYQKNMCSSLDASTGSSGISGYAGIEYTIDRGNVGF